MSELILKTSELKEVSDSRAEQIKKTFEPMAEMLEQFEESFNKVIEESKKEVTLKVTKDAKRLRIDIGKVRIATEKTRKAQKEEYLRAGKAIDGVSNILKWAVSEKEDKLKEIEKHFETVEAERLEKLQKERVSELEPFLVEPTFIDLSRMEPEVWDAYLRTKKEAHQDRIDAEAKAEAERLEKEKAEKEEQERIELENEKLKKEADEKEAELKAEREARELERKKELEKQEQERKEREEAEAIKETELKAERDKVEAEERKKQEALEAKLKAEREAKRILEDKIKADEEAKEKELAEIEAKKQSELQKGDADKLRDLISDLESLKEKYSFKSKRNIEKYNGTKLLIDKVVNYIKVDK